MKGKAFNLYEMWTFIIYFPCRRWTFFWIIFWIHSEWMKKIRYHTEIKFIYFSHQTFLSTGTEHHFSIARFNIAFINKTQQQQHLHYNSFIHLTYIYIFAKHFFSHILFSIFCRKKCIIASILMSVCDKILSRNFWKIL